MIKINPFDQQHRHCFQLSKELQTRRQTENLQTTTCYVHEDGRMICVAYDVPVECFRWQQKLVEKLLLALNMSRL